MAETKGFFRRIFSFGSPEADRTEHEGGMARVDDTTARRPDAADAEIHQPAAASTETDAEAGAEVDQDDDSGGITPLTPSSAGAPAGTTEKKTLN